VPGLLGPRWPRESAMSHAGAATGRAVGTQVTPRMRGVRPCCAPGANRPGRTLLGRRVGQRQRGLAASRHAGRAEPLGGCPCAEGRIRTPLGRGHAGRAVGHTEPPRRAATHPRRRSRGHAPLPPRRAVCPRRAGAPWPDQGARGGGGAPRRASSGCTRQAARAQGRGPHRSSSGRALRARRAELQAARVASTGRRWTGRRERRSALAVWGEEGMSAS
jgi:hypothetical protein